LSVELSAQQLRYSISTVSVTTNMKMLSIHLGIVHYVWHV